MEAFKHIGLLVDKFKTQFGKDPDIYFLKTCDLNTLLNAKDLDASIPIYFNDVYKQYMYIDILLIPVDDNCFYNTMMTREDLMEYTREEEIFKQVNWKSSVPIKHPDGSIEYQALGRSAVDKFRELKSLLMSI